MGSKKYILLSFDVEEFDLPLEYQQVISAEEQLSIGKQGLDAIAPILSDKEINCTLFTTANFANNFSHEIKSLSQQHEIASHTYYHSDFKNEHLLESRLALEKVCGKPVTGLRMPRMRVVEMAEVKKAGYEYDSSINPTLLPGRYNNLGLPRTVYEEAGVQRVPASVTPNLRIPLFWLSFKNLPYPVFKQLAIQTVEHDGYICLYFHPWEFTDIRPFKLPGYVQRHCGQPLLNRLQQLIKDLKTKGYEFTTIRDFLDRDI
ncbi:MAG: polysaccharide deacetylase family protein [Chitinophagaceae bacterium]|nr:polysaccharide deacetylase family protein [Chitinophagaceae bacterium]